MMMMMMVIIKMLFRAGVMVAARAATMEAAALVESVLRLEVTRVWGPGREFR